MSDAPNLIWNQNVRGDQVLPLINEDFPVTRIEAGPGTGKTFGVVRRVQRLLHPNGLNVHGDQVLVVAFNRVIASQLRVDIKLRLKDESKFEGKLPNVSTLHGLCVNFLGLDTRMLLEHEREAMIYDLLTLSPKLSEEFTNYNNLDQALKNHEAGHAKHDLIRDQTEKWLLRHQARLTGDLPSALLDSIKGGDYQEPRYSHIIVDEFQDLTHSEQELVFRLLTKNGALVALGDPRQSIYHFRGNDREGLSKLEELSGSKVKDLPMTECQRCPELIVKAANKLMVGSNASPMKAVSTIAANTHVVYWANPEEEARGMAKHIVECYKAHPEDRHLVMVSRRRFGYLLRSEMQKVDPDIDVELSFSESPLETWPAREAFLIFTLLTAPDPATWRAWLAYQTPNNKGEYMGSRRNSPAYLNLLSNVSDVITEESIKPYRVGGITTKGTGGKNVQERIERYFTLKFHLQDKLENIDSLIDAVFTPDLWAAGCDEASLTARTDIELLGRLATEIRSETSANAEILAKVVGQKLRAQIATRDYTTESLGNSVQVTTLWSAKGVTAEHVYVLGLCDQAIPGQRRPHYGGTDGEFFDEQMRLFYVTITRSKNTLVLSRPTHVPWALAMALGFQSARKNKEGIYVDMSRFLRSIIDELPDAVAGNKWKGCA